MEIIKNLLAIGVGAGFAFTLDYFHISLWWIVGGYLLTVFVLVCVIPYCVGFIIALINYKKNNDR